MKDGDFVGGFAKGLRVIEAFGEHERRLSIADVAKRAGLDRATVRRSLLTLAELGYADYDGKYFSLTSKVLRLGHSYLASMPLTALVQPYLDELARQTGQSSSASVLDDADIVYIARASKRRVMSINLNAGSRLPAYCSSMGRVLLAGLPPEQARDILARSDRRALTDRTTIGIDELVAKLEAVRRDGYALIDQELELGLCSIAVPLRNRQGETVAALNVGAPSAHTSTSQMLGTYLPQLLQAAENLRLAL